MNRILVKPRSHTLRSAERELHGKRTSKTAKTPAGYVLRNAKGVKEKKRGRR